MRFSKRVIFEIPIAALSLRDTPSSIASLIASKKKKTIICYLNAHCLTIAHNDPAYKAILQKASLVYSGGIGPVFASILLGRALQERVPTPDFIFGFLTIAEEKGWSMYLLGGREGVVKKVVSNLTLWFPKLSIVGSHHGYFGEEEEKVLIHDIKSKKPTIVLVGMGTPKQEKWIAANIGQIDAKAFWAVGALFDILSGELPRAPRILRNLGLEWLYRFLQEPRRLWKRYTLGNLQFLYFVCKEFLCSRSY